MIVYCSEFDWCFGHSLQSWIFWIFFNTTKFWKLSLLSLWGRRGRTAICSGGPLFINKNQLFHTGSQNILFLLPPTPTGDIKTGSISRTLWYRKPQDSGMDNVSETLVKCSHFLLLQFTFTVSEIKLKQLCVFNPFQNFMSTHFTTPSKTYSCWRKA